MASCRQAQFNHIPDSPGGSRYLGLHPYTPARRLNIKRGLLPHSRPRTSCFSTTPRVILTLSHLTLDPTDPILHPPPQEAWHPHSYHTSWLKTAEPRDPASSSPPPVPSSRSMFLVPTQNHFAGNHAPLPLSTDSRPENRPEATTSSLLSPASSSMERSAAEYSQSGLPSPYPSNCGDARSEGSSADQPSAAQYPSQQEVRPSNYSTSATPTSEYSVYPPSARSGSFPDHIQRSYHPASNPSGGSAGMAQQASSPSLPQQDGRTHQTQPQPRSDNDVPIDPSIAGPSPTYASYGQHSPYGPPPGDMSHSYQHAYPQPRPDWASYGQHSAGLAPTGHVFPPTPNSAPPQGRPTQVSHRDAMVDAPRCGSLSTAHLWSMKLTR